MNKEERMDILRTIKSQLDALQTKVNEFEDIIASDDDEIPDYPEFSGELGYYIQGGIVRYDAINDPETYFVYHSEDYAYAVLNKMREMSAILHCKYYLEPDFVPNYDDKEYHYYAVYDLKYNKYIVISFYIPPDFGFVAFKSKEHAVKCAEWMNKHFVIRKGDIIND